MKRFPRLLTATALICLCLTTPAALAKVDITGLESAAKDNVLLTLALAKEPCDAPEWKIRSLFAGADQEIDQALRALGYYHAVSKNSLRFNKDCWQADFAVTSGPQVIVTDIAITISGDADHDAEFVKLRNKLITATGKPLRHDAYEKMKSQLQSLAMARGYLDAEFSEMQLLIDKANDTARITLVFATGKRMLFGAITIDQDILQPEFVNKFVSVKSQDFYSSEELGNTYNALSKSGYFEQVDIRPDTDNTHDQQVPITIKLRPKKTHHYSVGIGYDTDIGPLLSGSYTNRRLNDRGHYLTSNIDLAPVLSTADVEYSVPLANPTSDVFSLGAGLKREDNDSYKSKTAKLSARAKHAFANGWKQTLFIDYSYEDFDTGTRAGETLLLVPGGSWLRSESDNPLRPTKGYRLEFNVAGSVKNPISDVNFAQGSASATWSQPLPWSGRFIGRTELGATLVDHFDKLSTSYRFFAGGMNSIRGYSYKELGPRDSAGNVEGGQFLSVVSAEYEQAILDNWGVAAFLDAGNAYNLDSINIKSGAGLGVRWYSPFGPVRVDFALPLNDADSSFQIHFAAGARI